MIDGLSLDNPAVSSASYFIGTYVIKCIYIHDQVTLHLTQVKHFCPSVPIILVGNKKDLRSDEGIKRELAKLKLEPVKAEEGRQMASESSRIKRAFFPICVLFPCYQLQLYVTIDL